MFCSLTRLCVCYIQVYGVLCLYHQCRNCVHLSMESFILLLWIFKKFLCTNYWLNQEQTSLTRKHITAQVFRDVIEHWYLPRIC